MGRAGRLRYRWHFLLLLLPLIFSGCVTEQQVGNSFVYTHESWLPMLMVLGGVVAAVGFFFFTEWRGRIACIVGFIFPLVFAPDAWFSKVTINKEGFKCRRAMALYFTEQSFLYQDIKFITIKESISRSRKRGTTVTHTLYLQTMKNGQSSEETLTVSDLMKGSGLDRILMNAVEKEIPIDDQRTRG